jgi:predicted RNA-binding protein YlxR (DUF448 family)
MARHAREREATAAAIGSAPEEAGSRRNDAARSVRRAERQPGRSCIVTRKVEPPSALIRFVLSPDGVVTPDIRRALPGRGVWVTATRVHVAEACKRKAFARAFRKEVATPPDLPDLVARLLREDALQALSLANKAGAITTGFEKVRTALLAGEALALIEASDGSADGRRKLLAGLAFTTSAPGGEPKTGEPKTGEPMVVDCFPSTDLDLALGRPHVIHAALLKAPVGGFTLTRCLRFRRFELIEKHASGGAERRGASGERRRIEPQDNRLND